MLDYTDVKSDSLTNIWNATKSVFPDISKAKYKSFITEWGTKYGFITPAKTKEPYSTDNKVKTEKFAVPAATQTTVKKDNVNPKEPETAVTDNAVCEKKEKPTTYSVSARNDTPAEKPVANANETKPAKKSSAQSLYDRLKQDIDKEQEAIITAFTDMITPVGKAFESIQGEINKSRAVGAENISLKAKIKDLEKQLSDIQTANQSLVSDKTEIEKLKKQISSLEMQNSELDSKLNDAYVINSRESSLEAEKIRSELEKAFTFLYEDWLEYEFSDVSEENYESLKAIIKKIFRSLERNGIDFKGNN